MMPRQLPLVFAAAIVGASLASAQQPTLGREQITTLAKAQVAIAVVHDSMNAELALQRNKKTEIQNQLEDKYKSQVEAVLKANALTDSSYQHGIFLVSTNDALRAIFDSVVVALTGTTLPGQVAGAPAPATVAVPPGQVGVHVGHVINSFGDTPGKVGLLTIAQEEAAVVLQHAQLATRQPTNLAYMQTHAGHVINAIDPTVIAQGPGKGYGLKKAAAGIAQHLDLAAKSEGATPAQIAHAGHAATSARNVEDRATQILDLAQKVRSATDAAEAAKLVNQIVSLAEQLVPGADANSDGRITWEKGEGGLAQVDEHIKLLLKG